ncbi:MAG: DUF123 domain-containing protein [Methanomicrobiales archaeon]|nr:DUF123 domain-containing protein [Methanomicrobiales archaeon]
MDKGIYCLVFSNPGTACVVKRLGTVAFRGGWHIYVGSALGPGGLARVGRHFRLAREHAGKPVWHVDVLLLEPAFRLEYALCGVTRQRLECRLAAAIGGDMVPRFGCSDCRCPSHLFYRKENPRNDIIAAFRDLGIECHEHNNEINGRQA